MPGGTAFGAIRDDVFPKIGGKPMMPHCPESYRRPAGIRGRRKWPAFSWLVTAVERMVSQQLEEHFSLAPVANRTPAIMLTGRADDGSPRVRGLTITADKGSSDIATTWSYSRYALNVRTQSLRNSATKSASCYSVN